MKKVKVYEMVGFNECQTYTTYCGVKVNLNFINGNTVQGKNATLRTDNPFAQDAIEKDERFVQGAIKLVGEYEQDEKPSTAEKMNTANGFGKLAQTESSARPSMAVSGNGDEKSGDARKKEVVMGVKNINDLATWFEENKGVSLTSSKKAYVKELCEEYEVEFPELKLK